LRLVGKFKKHKTSRQIKYKKTEANPIKQDQMCKFTQKHAQISFCIQLKQQKGHNI